MDISFAAKSASPAVSGRGKADGGAYVVGALAGNKAGKTAGAPVLLPSARAVDSALGGALTRAVAVTRFHAKPGQIVELVAPAGLAASRLILVGLGEAGSLDGARAEEAAAAVLARIGKGADTDVTFAIDLPPGAKIAEASLAAHLAMGARLKSYAFNTYRTRNRDEHESLLKRAVIRTADVAGAKKAYAPLSAVADGMTLARNLVNEPPNVLSPLEAAKRARAALSKLGVKVGVLGEAEMKKLGMGALVGVGQGSVRESQLVVMQWHGGKKGVAPVAFVGKGVVFDSGGLSLKPAASMMGMKGDMGGAAAVVGAMHALASRKARVNAVGVIGLVENMPDGGAQRPDDVVTSMSGQTIEVLNTDAEGRLVLADALTYTQRNFKPRFVIDLATLTGAILVSLGAEHAGLFSNDDALSEQIVQAGRAVGESVWRLPLGPAYDKLIRSKIADMKNIGGPYAGSITAAQFLQRFIEGKTPWAHLDIAGVAWQDGEQKSLIPSWGTGWGVRILDRLVADKYEG